MTKGFDAATPAVTVTVYDASGTKPLTVKEPLTTPFTSSTHAEAVNRADPMFELTLQAAELAKPDPEMLTTVVPGPNVGFRTMFGSTKKFGARTAESRLGFPFTVNV